MPTSNAPCRSGGACACLQCAAALEGRRAPRSHPEADHRDPGARQPASTPISACANCSTATPTIGVLRRRHLFGRGVGRHLRLLDLPDAFHAARARARRARGCCSAAWLLGSLMIVAMSAWLNASALAGAAAIQQHLAVTVQNYTRDLDTAHTATRSRRKACCRISSSPRRASPSWPNAERAGSLTGTAGSGTVVQLLTQMSAQLDGLGQEVAGVRRAVKALFEQGSKHLAKMRELISDRGPINDAQRRLRNEALALIGVIANLQQTSVAPAVKRAADVAVLRLHRAGRRRPHRRSRATGRPPWSARSRAAVAAQADVAVGRRRQDPGAAARSSRRASSRCRRPKPCCAMPAISSRAGRARSRST